MQSSEAPGSSGGSSASSSEGPVLGSTGPSLPPFNAAFSRWIRIVPFFLSAFLFLSGVFAMFSPLPLLLLNLQSKRSWAWLAALSNGVLVFALGGSGSLVLFGIFVVALALSLPEFLRQRKSLAAATGLTLLAMVLAGGLAAAIYAQLSQAPFFPAVSAKLSTSVDYLIQSLSNETRSSLSEGMEPDEWKRNFIVELPSAVAIFSLALVWVNLLLVLRLNPKRIREGLGLEPGFFKNWKAPEFLIWPTILAGFFQILDFGLASDIALNVFKFLLAIYAIQGLSILSFLFDVWNIRGFFRSLGFLIVVFLMMPLLLSIGFFDLWFDFRAKFRQS